MNTDPRTVIPPARPTGDRVADQGLEKGPSLASADTAGHAIRAEERHAAGSGEYFIYFPLSETLPNGVVALLVHPASPPTLALDGLKVVERAFTAEPTAVAGMGGTYAEIAAGIMRKVEVDPQSSDFGRTIEWTGFFVYYRGESAVGVSGVYRYLDEPTVLWLGRFGVVPEMHGTGLAGDVLAHSIAKARTVGATELRAFTDASDTNGRAQRFYEKKGFTLMPEVFMYQGNAERIYRLDLGPTASPS